MSTGHSTLRGPYSRSPRKAPSRGLEVFWPGLNFRRLALIALVLFALVFFYTLGAYGEAQYVLAQPFFWVAGWKALTKETKPRWYPHRLGETPLVVGAAFVAVLAAMIYRYTHLIPTPINLLQFVGACLFGVALAVGNDAPKIRQGLWRTLGAVGVGLYTAMCLGDVAYKYIFVGQVIATPLVAFFAALPVAVVAARDVSVDTRG